MLTKEDIILMYLADKKELIYKVDVHHIEPSEELRQAAIELGDPILAVAVVQQTHKPDEALRDILCKTPWYAYWYAYFVDKAPTRYTWQAACKESHSRWTYDKWMMENNLKLPERD